MMPGSAAFAATAIVRAVDERAHEHVAAASPHATATVGRRMHGRVVPWVAAAVVAVAAVAGSAVRIDAERDRVVSLQGELASVRTDLTVATQSGADTTALEARIAVLKDRLAELRKAKVRTVVEEKTVTETVTEWIPSGDEVTVEITGFEGRIELQDVQISHAYGFSDLIGIAINTSGETISYAQLGCTFVDEDGRIVANAIDNKQNWLPDQTWGFSCSAQVRATGGTLRVDEAV